MKSYLLLIIFIWFLIHIVIICSKPCSRENSRIVREYFTQTISSIYEKHRLTLPIDCIFSSTRDIFHDHEINKIKLKSNIWQCKYCNKSFYSEHYLDVHLSNRHNDTIVQNEQSVCLSDYCSIFRCDVLKRTKKNYTFLDLFIRNSNEPKRKSKKSLNEPQLTILRSRCASIINECIPLNIKYDTRVKVQHEMYAEVCAYLTYNRYFELPNYYKSFFNLTSVLCSFIFLCMCFIVIAMVRRSDWIFSDSDDDEPEKLISEETISTATALLSKSPRNSIIHSSKNSTSTVRHRVHFESLDDCNRLHSDHM